MHMNILKKVILGISTLGLVFSAVGVDAQGIKDRGMLNSIAGKAGVADQGSVEGVASKVIKTILSLTGLIFLILMVYAGVLWMTARGEESQVEKSQEIIKAAIIGLAVTVSAYAITVFVTGRLASTSDTSQYCQIESTAEVFECEVVPAGTNCATHALDKGYVSGKGPYGTNPECAAAEL